MEIRQAAENDIPSIVELLKLSLGESLMPKSEAFWRWKHVENPFGVSPVLLAFEGDQLIGVRAFMRWEWRQGDRIYKAVRAVDTATHPGHQGKGIFKNLTLQLVDQCAAEGVDFIFNTPNKSSRPGYLKMGWQAAGRLPIKFRLNGFSLVGNTADVQNNWNQVDTVLDLISERGSYHNLKTRISPTYLQWRYRHNPNVQYQVLMSLTRPFILIYRNFDK